MATQEEANQFAAELGAFLASDKPKPKKQNRERSQEQSTGVLEGLFGSAFKGL